MSVCLCLCVVCVCIINISIYDTHTHAYMLHTEAHTYRCMHVDIGCVKIF